MRFSYREFDPSEGSLRDLLKRLEALYNDLLLQAAKANPKVRAYPQPEVWFTSFGDSSLDFVLIAWFANTGDRWSGMIELRFEIDRLFREHQIEIPFPQRTLSIKGDEPLTVQLMREAPVRPDTKSAPAPSGPMPPMQTASKDVESSDDGDDGDAGDGEP